MQFNAKDTVLNVSLVDGKCSFSYGTMEDNKLIKVCGDFKDKCEISTEIHVNSEV
ncbi:hypothetical protein SDC9_177113 [bioreactor metagenome]|uniref:Uncharacterized protein n=1 Tax=bioreactor metagenome TaxID=1076179 RepID=A0A645GTM4_9ZZZZ